MNILLISAEVDPYAKVGGLADVAFSLPKALRQLGHDVRIMMPHYATIERKGIAVASVVAPFEHVVGDETFVVRASEAIDNQGVPTYFVDVAGMFSDREEVYGAPDDGRRFLAFCSGALACLQRLHWRPDVVHANDWHTAIVPVAMRMLPQDGFFRATASMLTIHNLTYQGVLARDDLRGLAALLPPTMQDAWINVMALGLLHADMLTTVSPTYAREIVLPEYGVGLDWLLRARQDRLFGVLNGIDIERLDPTTDPEIPARYSASDLAGKAVCKAALQQQAGFQPDPSVPLIGMIGRLVDQKGIDLFAGAIEPLFRDTNIQVVLLGTGAPYYIDLLRSLEERWPGRIKPWLSFHAANPQHIYAGADFFLMPSRFEPCGLGQLVAMRYGTVPIVRATGGLLDTVYEGLADDPGVGIVFWPYEVSHLYDAVQRAIRVFNDPGIWRTLVRNAMAMDYSWSRSAHRYVELYTLALEARQNGELTN